MDLLTMNAKELERLDILSKITERNITKARAAEVLGITPRHLYRLYQAFQEGGAKAITSKKRGKPSNRSYPAYYKEIVIGLIRDNYMDFGPTLASEKLSEVHNMHLSIETLRKWMIEAGIWDTRAKKRQRVYQPRYRRDCLGELIQIDGSDHHWFEDRAPRCTLLVTSKLMHMRFAKSENTFDYFKITREYLEMHGKPVALYSDKHSTFRVNKQGATTGTGMTQFGRALHEVEYRYYLRKHISSQRACGADE